jgi:hypothetical protein
MKKGQKKVKAEKLNEVVTNEVVVTEVLEGQTLNQTPTNEEVVKEVLEEPKEDVKVQEEVVIVSEPRVVQAFWHKACKDVKKSTKTTLKSDEHLRLTDGRVEILINEVPTQTSVYSLKRGNRIYYLYDVTPQDIVKAELVAKEKLAKATLTV